MGFISSPLNKIYQHFKTLDSLWPDIFTVNFKPNSFPRLKNLMSMSLILSSGRCIFSFWNTEKCLILPGIEK